MRFALIVIGLVAITAILAGCTQTQEDIGTQQLALSTSAPVYQETPLYIHDPPVKTGINSSYQVTDTEVKGCIMAVYSYDNGTTDMKNAPGNPTVCPTDTLGSV